MTDLVGRATELAEVTTWLGRRGTDEPRVLLIEGEAGIGKSALLAAAARAAAGTGWRVRLSRPTENEARFAYAGLTDLLAGTPPLDDGDLPEPQRHALDVALRRRVTDVPLDAHAVTLATIGRLTAGAAPVLLVVDDVPWLDAATGGVLAAVARRVPGDRVRLLVTRRTAARERPAGFPWELDRHLPPGGCHTIRLAGLDLGDLHELLRRRVDVRLSRAAVARIHRVSRGNPFYAVHLAAAGNDGATVTAVPPLTDLVASRLDAVPEPDRDVLLAVAASAVPRLARLRAALAPEPVDAAVERAEAAGLITVGADGRLTFDHPLIASALYDAAPAPRQRLAHRRLAAVEPETEARARHLALGTLGPDDGVAAELDRAARDARLRGATDVAAELMDLALARGTGRGDRRAVLLADYQLNAGDADAAARTLDGVLPALEAGPLRARARFLRGTAAWFTGGADAAGHLRPAVDDAAAHPELRGRILARLAVFCEHDVAEGRDHAAAAVAALEDAGAKDPLAGALCGLFYAEVQTGGTPRPDLLERAVALEDPRGNEDHSTVPGIWAMALDRSDEARDRYRTLLERDRSRGDLSSESDLLTKLAEVEIWAGDWAAARSFADAAVRSARLVGDNSADPSVRQRLLLAAHEGGHDEAGAAARARADELVAADEPLLAVYYLAVATFAAASAGEPHRVLELTERVAQCFAGIGVVEPVGRMDPAAERMEALVHVGRSAEAERLLADVRVRLDRIARPWLEAAWRRAAAELTAATGDLTAAVELAAPPPGTQPFDRARTLLTRGRLLRRARRTGAAREVLDDAVATFTRLGARAWAARSTAELSRLGLSRRGGDELTPTELRVARLAAAGATNRAVADELAMSPKTVEAHLARAYRKLGIRTRAELGSLLGGDRPHPARP